ncbi:hypothetical protein SAMN05877809_1079 [Rhodobacter sp. JA431]|uniref:hypothetical protein n=1 Tax=Rhodobacter sp. JA431 TaxID=570013 RepID=UPI000BCB388B|nr:hypothetical protein [Rhodobacter sp. JA431]SOC13753.1 hypothetical protein SAMN05877809_1079 [Rhodobacter sp. JA431]
MSGAERKEIRAAAKAALAAAPGLADATQISAWVQSVDAESLPAYGVATPIERQDRIGHDLDQCDPTLVVVLKLLGGAEIEDVLDDHGDLIAPLVIAAVAAENRSCLLAQTETRAEGDGGKRVGTLTLTFTVTYWADV